MANNILVILSSILTIAAAIPYIIDVVSKKTKPRIVSWLIWSTLLGISCAAAFVEQQYTTAILLLLTFLSTLAVALLGWKHGDKKIERLDAVCLAGAIVGIILWWVFNSPSLAVIASIAIDLTGGIPTLVHAWKKPGEETWVTFVLYFLGAVCTLLTVSNWRITAFAYPLFLVIINLAFASVVLVRRRMITNAIS